MCQIHPSSLWGWLLSRRTPPKSTSKRAASRSTSNTWPWMGSHGYSGCLEGHLFLPPAMVATVPGCGGGPATSNSPSRPAHVKLCGVLPDEARRHDSPSKGIHQHEAFLSQSCTHSSCDRRLLPRVGVLGLCSCIYGRNVISLVGHSQETSCIYLMLIRSQDRPLHRRTGIRG
jgi:hypothetical protein